MEHDPDVYAGVVFDLDGVIVETEQLWEESWRDRCAVYGGTWTPQDTARVQGMSAPEWAAYLAEKLTMPDRAEALRRECVDAMIRSIASGDGGLLPGARELVEAVSGRVPVALASSAARPVMDAVLAHHRIADRFSATVSSEEVARGKPSPDVYVEAAARIGVAPPTGLAVEDSSNGIRAAHAAGLHVVALPNSTYPPVAEALDLADHVANDHAGAMEYVLAHLPEEGRR